MSLKAEIKRFGETVSVRAISNLIKSESRTVKLCWFLAVLTSTSLLLWQLESVFSTYSTNPYVSTYSENNGEDVAVFPDITICNINPLMDEINMPNHFTWNDYLSYMKMELGRELSLLDEINNFLSNAKLQEEDFVNFISFLQTPNWFIINLPPIISQDLSKENSKFIVDHLYYTWNWLPINSSDSDIQVFWDSAYYECYTYRPSETSIGNIRGSSFILNINDFPNTMSDVISTDPSFAFETGVRVAIHSPGTMPNIKTGMSIGPGSTTIVSMMPTIRKRLDKPYNIHGCSDQMYLDNSADVVYSWEACYDTCLQNITLNKCGCVMPFYQFTKYQLREANYRVCLNQSSEASNRPNITLAIRDLLCLKRWLTVSEVNCCDAKCLLPCEEVYYDVSVTSAPWPHISQQMAFYKSYIKSNPSIYGNRFDAYEEVLNSSGNHSETQTMSRLRNINLIRDNFLQLKFVLKSRIPFVLVDQPLMNASLMISSIGGSPSLWLGITVMTFAEVIEFMYTLLVCCYEKQNLLNRPEGWITYSRATYSKPTLDKNKRVSISSAWTYQHPAHDHVYQGC